MAGAENEISFIQLGEQISSKVGKKVGLRFFSNLNLSTTGSGEIVELTAFSETAEIVIWSAQPADNPDGDGEELFPSSGMNINRKMGVATPIGNIRRRNNRGDYISWEAFTSPIRESVPEEHNSLLNNSDLKAFEAQFTLNAAEYQRYLTSFRKENILNQFGMTEYEYNQQMSVLQAYTEIAENLMQKARQSGMAQRSPKTGDESTLPFFVPQSSERLNEPRAIVTLRQKSNESMRRRNVVYVSSNLGSGMVPVAEYEVRDDTRLGIKEPKKTHNRPISVNQVRELNSFLRRL